MIFPSWQKYVLGVLAAALFAASVWFSNQPAHWDETAYLDGARRVALAHGFPFTEFWSYKPPLFFEIGAALFGIFGEVRWPHRLFAGGVYVATVLLVWKLLYIFISDWQKTAKNKFSGENTFLVSLAGATIFAILPVIIGQAFLYQPELWLLGLWLGALLVYVARRRTLYWLLASALVLSKEAGVLYVLVVSALHIWFNRHRLSGVGRELAWLLSPLLWFAAWLIGNKIFLGWWLWPFNIQFFTAAAPYHSEVIVKLQGIFGENWLWVVTSMGMLGIIWLMGHWSEAKPKISGTTHTNWQKIFMLLGGGALAQLVFGLVGAFIPRYVLAVPVFLVLGLVVVLTLIMKRSVSLTVLVVFLLLGIFLRHEVSVWQRSDTTGWARDQDLRYQVVTKQYQDLYRWWQAKYPTLKLYGDWLAVSYFVDPLYGYVSQPSKVALFEKCEDIEPQTRNQIMLATTVDDVDMFTPTMIAFCAEILGLEPRAVFGPIVVYTAKDAQTSTDCGDFCEIRGEDPLPSDCGIAGVCQPSSGRISPH